MLKFLLLIVNFANFLFAANKSFDVTEIFGATNHTVFAGYMNTSINTTSQMFYHIFSPLGKSFQNNNPIIFWFQGGPGCSSWLGSLTEIGPFQLTKVKGNIVMKYNPFNWAINNNLVFVDQPFGVGFSSKGNGTSPNMTESAADQVENFFKEFYQTYPQFKNNPLYIAGESYAGHYVPSFASRLISKGYVLSGIMIGDGYTFPLKQVRFSEFQLAAGIISRNRFNTYQDLENKAIELMIQQKFVESADPINAETGEVPNSQDISNITGADLLNYRLYSSTEPADYSGEWLDSKEVRKAFQVPSEVANYDACSVPIYETFSNDVQQSFAGQNDIEVNTAGSYKWIAEIDWDGSSDFATANKSKWIPNNDGVIQGFVKKASNLTFVQVNNCGHLVPQDQPQNAFSMITSWMNGNL